MFWDFREIDNDAIGGRLVNMTETFNKPDGFQLLNWGYCQNVDTGAELLCDPVVAGPAKGLKVGRSTTIFKKHSNKRQFHVTQGAKNPGSATFEPLSIKSYPFWALTISISSLPHEIPFH